MQGGTAMKTLIIVSHPNISKSVINKQWIEELQKYPEKYTVHELKKEYPDEKIDVKKEQQLVEEHGTIIFQFPINWYASPPILKKWIDNVLTYGWAFGKNGDKFQNRKVALAVSAGIKKEDYQSRKYHYTLEELLAPFEATFRGYCHADYGPLFAFYGATAAPSKEEIEQSAKEYLNFIENL